MTRARLVFAVVVVLLAAGCGGGGKAPAVASLGAPHTTSTSDAPSADPSGIPSGRGEVGISVGAQNGEKFSVCMRAHGVPNFPDPNAQGVIQFGSSSGIDPGSPKVQAALQACRSVLPNGGRPSPQQVAKMQKAALAFSACMRNHGLKDFPDPNFSGGGINLSLKGGPGSDLDPNSPLFQKARTACQGILPGKLTAVGGK